MPMRRLVSHAIGGGWGQDSPGDSTEEVSVIRGADFPSVRLGDISHLPVRWEARKKLAPRLLKPGDIILEISGGTSDRPTGRTVFVTERLLQKIPRQAIPASFCRLVRIDPTEADPYFIYWWLQWMYVDGRTWTYQNRSTGIANFQFEHFLDAEIVSLPSHSEQRAIAATLGALDDKIESDQRMRNLLWSLIEATWDQLTEVASERPLGDVLDLVYGKSLPAVKRTHGSIPVFGSNGVTGWHNASLVTGPVVVVGRKGSIGEVHWSHVSAFPIDTTFYVRPRDHYPLVACYVALQRAGLRSMNSDSAIPGLNRERALLVEVALPSQVDAIAWAERCSVLLQQIAVLERQIKKLEAVRNVLLPELLSGRIRVSNAREAIQEVVS